MSESMTKRTRQILGLEPVSVDRPIIRKKVIMLPKKSRLPFLKKKKPITPTRIPIFFPNLAINDKKGEHNKQFCGINPILGGKLNLFEDTMGLTNSLNKVKKHNPCLTLNSFFPKKCLPKGWRITDILGNGSFGFVFSTIGPKNERGALKVVKEDDDESEKEEIEREITFNKLFHHLGLSPEYKNHCKFEPEVGVILHTIHMGRVDSTVEEYLQQDRTQEEIRILVGKIFELLDKMDKNYVTHGDFHFGNIGLTKNRNDVPGKMLLIDFGFSSIQQFTPTLDIYQLLRVNMYYGDHDNRVRKEFDTEVRRMASEKYNLNDIPTDLRSLSNHLSDMREKINP